MINYHGHTYRCKHASGTDEEYVIRAIEAGYETIGFSDHVMLPNCNPSGIRASIEEKEGYYKSIKELKEKYKDKIQILLAFECEYNDLFIPYYQQLLKEVDYLIFGNHASKLIFTDDVHYSFNFEYEDTLELLTVYFETAKKALNSGFFKIFAHPDLFMSYIKEWTPFIEEKCFEMCKLAKEKNVALELNCGCILHDKKRFIGEEFRFRYPYSRFFEVAKKVGNTIVIGVDAHNPNDYINIEGRKEALKFASDIGLNITDKLDTIG